MLPIKDSLSGLKQKSSRYSYKWKGVGEEKSIFNLRPPLGIENVNPFSDSVKQNSSKKIISNLKSNTRLIPKQTVDFGGKVLLRVNTKRCLKKMIEDRKNLLGMPVRSKESFGIRKTLQTDMEARRLNSEEKIQSALNLKMRNVFAAQAEEVSKNNGEDDFKGFGKDFKYSYFLPVMTHSQARMDAAEIARNKTLYELQNPDQAIIESLKMVEDLMKSEKDNRENIEKAKILLERLEGGGESICEGLNKTSSAKIQNHILSKCQLSQFPAISKQNSFPYFSKKQSRIQKEMEEENESVLQSSRRDLQILESSGRKPKKEIFEDHISYITVRDIGNIHRAKLAEDQIDFTKGIDKFMKQKVKVKSFYD